MKTRAVLLAASALAPFVAHSQTPCSTPAVPDATVTAEQDRDNMLCRMGLAIPVLPPLSKDPNRPKNAWPKTATNPEGNWTDSRGHTVVRTNFGLWHTYDSDAGESGGAMSGHGDYGPGSTPRYSDIDLLKMQDGAAVKRAEDWWTRRRPELLALTQQELYGRPIDPAIAVTWQVSAESIGTDIVEGISYAYREKTLTGTVDTSTYPQLRDKPVVTAQCRYPAAPGRKYPVVITFGEGVGRFQYTAPFGIATCSYSPKAVQPDTGAGGAMSSYLIGLVNKGQWRKPEDGGALVAWGWGVSRLIDRFATDPDFDADKVALEGHSRYGKAALVTAVYDERVAVVWPSDAGALGTAPARRHYGESLEFVASSSGEYHWVAGNILKYAGPLKAGGYIPRRVELLDVDAHSTTALVAPRAIFVTNGSDTPPGSGDAWSDPRGTFLSGKMASPVWELLGWKGQVIPPGTVFTSGQDESIGGTPPFNVAFIDGTVGWRRQIEGHTPVPNWPTFMTFAARYLKDGRPVVKAGQAFTMNGRAAGLTIGTATASDPDNETLRWQIKGGTGVYTFAIDPVSGAISLADAASLERAGTNRYTLVVTANDGKLSSREETIVIARPAPL